MRSFASLLAVLLVSSSLAAGEAALDRHAKAIAPFVNGQSFAVGHLDVSHLNVDAVAKILTAAGMEQVAAMKTKAAQVKTALLQAGGRDVYVLLNWSNPLDEFLLVAPLGKEAGDELAALVREVRGYAAEVRAGVLLAGPKKALARLQDFKVEPAPVMAKAFATVGDGSFHLVLVPPAPLQRAVVEMVPELPKVLGGVRTSELQLRWAAVRLDVGAKLAAKIVVQAANAHSAAELGKVLERGLTFARKNDELKRLWPEGDKVLSLINPRVEQESVTVSLDDERTNKSVEALLIPLLAKQRVAAARKGSMNHLKQLALAMHIFHDAHRAFPAAATYDAKGQPLLSWRVHILPYIEQEALFQQFHLNEPWDSAHNKKLLEKMPETYRSPSQKNLPAGKTNYLVPVGAKTMFEGKKGLEIRKITDGTSNTIMIVEADDSRAVYWTQPEDYTVDAKNPFAGLVRPGANGFSAAFADGSVQFLSATLDPATLRALFTASGGEPIKR